MRLLASTAALLALAGATVVWALVLGPLTATRPAGSVSWPVVLAAVVAVLVPLAVVHALVRSPERDRHLRLALLGLSVVSAGDLASARSYALHEDAADTASAVLWTLGWAVVLVGVLAPLRRAQRDTRGAGLRGGATMTHVAAAISTAATACGVVTDQSTGGGAGEPVLFWLSSAVLVLVAGRTLLELRRTHRLQRHLERRVAERTQELADSERRFAALVAHTSDVALLVSTDLHIVSANPGAARLLGAAADPGRSLAQLLHPDDDPGRSTDVLRAVLTGRVERLDLSLALRHADGHRVDVEAVVTDLQDDPDVRGLVINARDVTEAVRLEAALSRQAFSDALTGLPNRALFRDRLEHALRSRSSRGQVKVCYLDLDGFKAVNDTLGHDAGDELLVAVAERLRAEVRAGDTVARLGGDEFAVLLDDGALLDEAEHLARRICEALRLPYALRGAEVHVSASVGLASTRTAGRDAEQLVQAADLAMYAAKSLHRGGHAVYHPSMREDAVERAQLKADLHRAVEEEQFRVVYQPLVDMGSGGVSGVEALVRWHHPERGVVVPLDFIPLAESTGLIDAIGAFVLREACQQVATWRAEVPGAEQMHLSVNLSGHQLHDPDLVATVVDVLATTGLPASSLVLEITETSLVDQHEAVLAGLGALRALGIRLAIDDFGTGYSSLSYLHRLPVDIIKIDKSFVDRLSDTGDLTLVDAILSMAATLGMTTVAEGVEHEHQRAALTAQGCGTGQGYHFSPPVDPHLLPELVVTALLTRAGGAEPGADPAGGAGRVSPGASGAV